MKTPATETRPDNPRLPAADCSPLRWRKGPAQEGGEGTAGVDELGRAIWWDGETIMTIVHTNSGTEYDILNVYADDDQLCITLQATGDAWGREPEDIEWWAKLDAGNLPMENDQADTSPDELP